ncbi:MAG: hypothetical protein V7K67_06770 [Nostoc sp.]|uniref:hypothetical protein n=1 Tax=Nostoc sp. TaxID=1180 RepID=UPI002FF23138
MWRRKDTDNSFTALPRLFTHCVTISSLSVFSSSIVKQFWILDLQFGIDPDHKGTGLGDLRLTILDLFRLTSGGA